MRSTVARNRIAAAFSRGSIERKNFSASSSACVFM
jgi:hypothetical protein